MRIARLEENQSINVENEDLFIDCDIPVGVNIHIMDGDVVIHGAVGERVLITAKRTPQINFKGKNGSTFVADSGSIQNGMASFVCPMVSGNIQFTQNGFMVDGEIVPLHSIQKKTIIRVTGDTVVLNGDKCIVDGVEKNLSDFAIEKTAPSIPLKTNITITGNVASSAVFKTRGLVTVKGKVLENEEKLQPPPSIIPHTNPYETPIFENLRSPVALKKGKKQLQSIPTPNVTTPALSTNSKPTPSSTAANINRIFSPQKKQRMELDLYEAAEKGTIETVIKILQPEIKSYININAQRAGSKRTPLHIAIINGHVQIARLLLEAGASAGIADAYKKQTARAYAAQSNKPEITSLFHLTNGVSLH